MVRNDHWGEDVHQKQGFRCSYVDGCVLWISCGCVCGIRHSSMVQGRVMNNYFGTRVVFSEKCYELVRIPRSFKEWRFTRPWHPFQMTRIERKPLAARFRQVKYNFEVDTQI